MKQYQELDAVSNPTMRSTLDSAGSTVDRMFADAIFASMPTLVVREKGLLRGYDVEGQRDIISVPVFKNFDLTFTNLSGTGSDTGSSLTLTAANAITYVDLRPVFYSAGLFITEVATLLTNAASFEEHVARAGVATQRHFDRSILNTTVLSETNVGTAYVYSASAFALNGSVIAGSTLGPLDLSDAKASLSSGSDVYVPDVALMHPTQYNQLIQSSDFRADTYRVGDKAVFAGGQLVAFDGMEIVVTELVNGVAGSATTAYTVNGHPVAVFSKNKSAAYAIKSEANRVRTWNDITRHGTNVIIDIMYDAKVLIPESIRIIRCADA